MSKGKKKQNQNNKLRDPDHQLAEEQFLELNKEFYNEFLEDFYSMKVINLLSLITNTEKSISNLMENPIEIDKLKIEPQVENIKSVNLIRYAKAELAMSYFHCLETFIRLFVAHAKLSGCPWLELARLDLPKYKGELKKISNGEFNHFNSRASENETILYVFTGQKKPEGEITAEFIEGYKTWLSFAASQLLKTYDYNAFKHGLAISPTQNGFTIGRTDEEFKLEAHGEVIEHLTRMTSGDRVIWAKQTNFVEYDRKATFILFVEKLMTSILDVGRKSYLLKNEGIRVYKAHKFLPKDILETGKNQDIQVENFSRGLLYNK
ncbi:hypothetical protein [Peribacillus butanolivorans]|uniref:hypothetical protein n=1 Tax=Peribacillus butanolivorans TaxID=421767 RepID=UPI00365B2E74